MANLTNDTTRMFPRTLQEAFPDGVEYASSVEVTYKHIDLDIYYLILWSFVGGFLAGFIYTKLC
jgi:hypothetical protein